MHITKLHWLKVGDKNNKAFHNAAKVRETRNAIREIKCADGNIVSSQEEIKKELKDFFMTFFPLNQTQKFQLLRLFRAFHLSDAMKRNEVD